MIFDIETNGFNPDRIWCMSYYMNGQYQTLVHPTRDEVQALVDQCQVITAHNGIAFDVYWLEKLLGVDFSNVKVCDTLVLSRLDDPSRDGGHSLKAWGNRFGFPKGEHDDWSQYTPEMGKYCEQDVAITKRLMDHLESRFESSQKPAIELEHEVFRIISQQIRNGWYFREKEASVLAGELRGRLGEVEDEVRCTFKPLPVFQKEVTPKYRKSDGSLSMVGLGVYASNPEVVSGPFSRVEWPEFNLGSRKQIGLHLQALGWKPSKLTPTGQPMVDETILSKVDIPEAQLIAEYLILQKHIAMIESWMDKVGPDYRIHGYVNSCGAVTGRMTHRDPNLAQVPSRSIYGPACRGLFGAEEGYDLVGCDASGLELRMLAHYMDDEDYTREVIHGDIHTANQIAAGLETRDQAKTFIYAFLYGAGDAKIGSIVGGSARVGKELKARFLRNTPALAGLRNRVERASKRGYLTGLDGRHMAIRSSHAALNTLLQGAGAIVMKKALCILDEYATLNGMDYKFVGNIHDEIQTEVRSDQAHWFGDLAKNSIVAAGQFFNLRCPLDGEYKVGDTWAQTH